MGRGRPARDRRLDQDGRPRCCDSHVLRLPLQWILVTVHESRRALTGLGHIEKSAVPPFDGDVPTSAIILARNQPNAMSFALDGTNVYWTTSRCDIDYIADSPQ